MNDDFLSSDPFKTKPSVTSIRLTTGREIRHDITPGFVEELLKAMGLYLWLGFGVTLGMLVLCVVLLFFRFLFQGGRPLLQKSGRFFSLMPRSVNECLPQIFWLFLISRTSLITEGGWGYALWLTIIAFTFTPVVIDQIGARIDELRSRRFVDAEMVAGKSMFRIFWRDMVLRHLTPALMIQWIYLLSSLILMESCMVFLARVQGSEPSLASMLYAHYEEVQQYSFSHAADFLAALSLPFWIILVLIVSMVMTLRNIAKRVEGEHS